MNTDETTDLRRAATGYLRVSTDEQADSGLGLEAQRAAIEAEADRRDLVVTQWFADEGISGSQVEKRPGFLALLDSLMKGDTVIVAKRDRLARGDAYLSAWIEKEIAVRQASVVSAAGEGNGDDPASMLMRRMVDAFAEYELQQIRARTCAALQAKRRRGERISRFAPYGFRHQGNRLVADDHEQAGVKLARELRARGATLREVSARMAEKGFTARTSRPLSAQAVSNLLKAAADN